MRERSDHAAAIDSYRRALALGGSRPLPELFAAAGPRFAMNRSILAELIPRVMQRIREFQAG
jgi:oligoendopeptidase F